MSRSFNTCFIDTDGLDVSRNFVEKQYLIDVYPNLIDPVKAPALWVWGSGNQGSLGTNSSIGQSSPVQTVSGGTNWKQVSAGQNNVAAIKTNGTLWLWGTNTCAVLGDNSTVSKSSPVQTVSGGTNWRCVSVASGSFSATLKTDGTLWLWGLNSTGQLGTNNVVSASSPVQTVSGGTNWKSIEVGQHAAAIKTDSTLWLWGSGSIGVFGNNSTTDRSSPVQTVSGGTNWKQVSVDGNNSGAIKCDGTLWLWGNNGSGQLATDSTVSQSSPVQTISGGTNWKQVSVGTHGLAAIKTDSTLWVWGSAVNGFNSGDNTSISRSSPVQTVSGGTNWKKVMIATGPSTTGGGIAIKTDGTLWVWGSSNITGDNTAIGRSSPVQTVSGGTNWKDFAGSPNVVAAIREEGDW